MKNQQSISQFKQFKQFKISTALVIKISGGTKRAQADSDEEIE
ncbi:MAG: hypothetical protein AB8B65_10045 [Kordia sp.]